MHILWSSSLPLIPSLTFATKEAARRYLQDHAIPAYPMLLLGTGRGQYVLGTSTADYPTLALNDQMDGGYISIIHIVEGLLKENEQNATLCACVLCNIVKTQIYTYQVVPQSASPPIMTLQQ